jgi:hypothetical protein
MRRTALAAVFAAVGIAAGCGDTSGSSPLTFKDKKAFETYVAGALSVERVSCAKTSHTAARCKTPGGRTALVLCETADAGGGHNCTISYKD